MKTLLLLAILLLSHSAINAAPLPVIARQSLVLNVPRGGKAAAATTNASSATKPASTAIIEGLKNTLASGLAAACSKTLLAPFDTIKTVQQDVKGGTSLKLMEAARKVMARPGGIFNLYAGLGVSVLGAMPSVGLYFGVYSYCKRTIGPTFVKRFGSEREDGKEQFCSDRAWQTFSIALSAAIGNTVASFSRVPYEVVKQSLQTGQYPSTANALSTMWKQGGMRSFFPLGSVSIQMVRDIPYAVFTLLSYEYIKENWVLKKSVDDPNNRWLRDMIAGATAGGIGSYLTNPFDVIKTRLQTTDIAGAALYGGSISKCAMSVLEEGGAAAFLRGSVPRLLHKVPANGFFFVFYEFFKRALNSE
eukprot:g12849.t1 g12849   contig7:305530-306783(+)